ncbi:MAG: DUF1816 domain-containing protein [Leptolyngbyaceae cyanobacterium MAG.088]|nr:DUF1816 domain-containing protein [Leptolyngbyaceae cyanobacterium MAG.088]
MENLINQVFGLLNKSWWLEIMTASPSCGYFFGPFDSESEALEQQLRHVKDIEYQGHEVLLVSVVRRQAPEKRMVHYSEAA